MSSLAMDKFDTIEYLLTFVKARAMQLKKINLLLFPILGTLLLACSNGSTSSSSPSIQYTTLNYNGSLPAGGYTGLTGIRQVESSTNVYITGNYTVNGESSGTLYVGPITGGGIYYLYNYPDPVGTTTSGTNVYSADNGSDGNVLLTGTYTTAESGMEHAFGFYYNGPVGDESAQSTGVWQTLVFPESQVPGTSPVSNTYPHSIMGGLIVGNYATAESAGNGFIYDTTDGSYTSVNYPNSRYTSIYGIWWNSESSYTITGGFSQLESDGSLNFGFIADYNSQTHTTSNWTSYSYNNQIALFTHFEGITSDGAGGYNLAGSGIENGINDALVNVTRTSSGGFTSTPTWVINIAYPGATTTTSDTVYQNYLLGVYTLPSESGLNGYVATIPTSWY